MFDVLILQIYYSLQTFTDCSCISTVTTTTGHVKRSLPESLNTIGRELLTNSNTTTQVATTTTKAETTERITYITDAIPYTSPFTTATTQVELSVSIYACLSYLGSNKLKYTSQLFNSHHSAVTPHPALVPLIASNNLCFFCQSCAF